MKLLSFLFYCFALAVAPAWANPVTFQLTVQLPITSDVGQSIVAFKERVETATNKGVQIELLHGTNAIEDQKVPSEVASGKIAMGLVNIGVLGSVAPVTDFIHYPFLLNFEALVRAVTDPQRPLRTVMDDAILKSSGLRVLWWLPYGSNVLFSKGIDGASPSNVRGRKVRVYSDSTARQFSACGAVPLIISASKQKEALETGQVDFVMTGVAGVQARELWKVADTITRTENAPLEFVVSINDRIWRSLDRAAQIAIRDAAVAVERELREKTLGSDERHYEFARSKGMKIVSLRPDQLSEWRACSWPAAEAVISNTGAAGAQLMTLYGRLRTDPCCSSDPSALRSSGVPSAAPGR